MNLIKQALIFALLSLCIAPIHAQTNDTIHPKKQETMNKMLGLRTTCYKVADLSEATAWYAKAFQTAPYFNEPFYVGFNINGYELGLLPEEEPVTQKAESVLTYWGVNDIEAAWQRLITLGATEHEKPTNVGGELMTAAVKDPWGNIIGLIYNPAFKAQE